MNEISHPHRADEDGKYIAYVPTIPGCWIQSDTHEEAVENIQDAMRGYLDSLCKHSDPIPVL